MRRRALFLAVAATVLFVAAGAQAVTPSARRSMVRARKDAASELTSVLLPKTARKVKHDPSVHRALARQGVACTRRYVVEDHGFWRVAGKPARVWSWLRHHPPAHAGSLGYGELKHRGTPVAWYVLAFFPDQRNVTSRMISIALRPARRGGTAIRVDAIAVGEPRPHHAPCFSAGPY